MPLPTAAAEHFSTNILSTAVGATSLQIDFQIGATSAEVTFHVEPVFFKERLQFRVRGDAVKHYIH